MFRTWAIILRIQKIRDKRTRIVLFTKDYGKVTCWHNRHEFLGDIGDVIEAELDRHLSENLLKHYEIQEHVHHENWSYSRIISFLEIIYVLYALLPEASSHIRIFGDYLRMIYKMKDTTSSIGRSHYILIQLRILKQLGFINDKDFTISPKLHYIHNHVATSPIDRILQAKMLQSEEEQHIVMVNQKTLHSLQSQWKTLSS